MSDLFGSPGAAGMGLEFEPSKRTVSSVKFDHPHLWSQVEYLQGTSTIGDKNSPTEHLTIKSFYFRHCCLLYPFETLYLRWTPRLFKLIWGRARIDTVPKHLSITSTWSSQAVSNPYTI